MSLCKFETIGENEHRCTRCGYTLKAPVRDITTLKVQCNQTPGTVEKVGNFVKSMVNFAKDSFKTASPEEQERRMEICRGCEHFNGTSCGQCGCVMDFKSRIAGEECPIGKW